MNNEIARVTRSRVTSEVKTATKSNRIKRGSHTTSKSKNSKKGEDDSENENDEESDGDDDDGEYVAAEADFNSDEEDEEEDGDETYDKRQHAKRVTNRPAHTKKMGLSADILVTADQMRLVSLARHRNILKPFITEKVYNILSTTLQKRGQDSSGPELKRDEQIIKQPKSLVKCTMRNYQVEGLSWLVNNYHQRINCMLGDEMGLGKTLQSISFVAYMLHVKKVAGPFLFVVPLTVLFNWMNEFRKWCPTINVLRVHTTDTTEQERLKSLIADPKTEVVVTTYEIIKTGGLSQVLRRVVWRATFLDEGHRIRNEDNIVSRACCGIRSEFKVILTGTPLQNNLRETGGLLKFLAPNVFTDLSLFDDAFNLNSSSGPGINATSNDGGGLQIDREMLNKAHYMIRPFLLRRIKSEVEQKLPAKIETKIDCPMTEMQKELTQFLLFRQRVLLAKLEQRLKEKIAKEKERQQQLVLEQLQVNDQNMGSSSPKRQEVEERNLEDSVVSDTVAMTSANDDSDKPAPLTVESSQPLKKKRKRISESTRLADSTNSISASESRGIHGLLAHLRKAANHPYLFEGIEKINSDGTPTEEIVSTSGKMIILDKLLSKLKDKGHRVVLFSQFTHTLDIICDYLEMRGHLYQRLDGSTNRVMREVRINLFNKPNSEYFIFALSTRAGGEGVNLYTADTVILFDSDWNPQVDIQAMARVHRIGQTKVVHVYRMVTKGSIDECIVHRAQKKLFLDSMVNRGSTSQALALDKQMQEEKKKKKIDGDFDRLAKRQKRAGSNDDNEEGDESTSGEEEGDGLKDENEEEDEFDMMNTSRLFATLKFGWNSAFSAGHSDSKKPEEMISDADIDVIIDRTRGIEIAGSSIPKDSSAGDQAEPIDLQLARNNETISGIGTEPVTGESKLKENQEISIDTFDEHVPLVKIDNIREQSLMDLESEWKETYEQGNQEALTTALGGGQDDVNNEVIELNARGRPKRQSQSRTVNVHVAGVGLVSILKPSNLNLSDGTDNSKSAKKSKGKNILEGFRRRSDASNNQAQNSTVNGGLILPTSNSIRQVAGRDYQHQDMCQICWDGGEVLVCDGCPCSYHLSCLGLKKIPNDFMWYCPHHICATCHRKIQAAGLLFRCMNCENAYCEDCLPAESEIVGECQRFRDLGFRWPSNACYIKCSIDCIEFDPNAPEESEAKKKNRRVAEEQDEEEDMDEEEGTNNEEDDDVVSGDDQVQDRPFDDETPSNTAKSNKYNPVLALAFCSLQDVKDRLNRDEFGLHSRFLSLGEVPNFVVRYQSAPLMARATIQHIVNFIVKHDDANLEATDNKLEEDAANDATREQEQTDAGDHGKSGSEEEPLIQTLLNFTGISTKHSFDGRARIFLAVVKILANTSKATLPQIAQALGICHARHIRPPTKVEASMNYIGYKNEPKFNFPLNTQRRILEESIAAFLVILSPQNLLIPWTGKVENPVKKDIAGLLYTARLLQALGEPLYDSNHFYFTSYALRDASDAGVRDWMVQYPSGKPADSAKKLHWMLPIVRLYVSIKSFTEGKVSPGLSTSSDGSLEAAKKRATEWIDIDSVKLLNYLKYCENVVNDKKREMKQKQKELKEAEERAKRKQDFAIGILGQGGELNSWMDDNGVTADVSNLESGVHSVQQQVQSNHILTAASNNTNMSIVQQQQQHILLHQQRQQQQYADMHGFAAIPNNMLLPSIPPLPPQLQHIIPTATSVNSIDRDLIQLQRDQQRLLIQQKEEQKRIRIQREEERLRAEQSLRAIQLQRHQEIISAQQHANVAAANEAMLRQQQQLPFPAISQTATMNLPQKTIELNNAADLTAHISVIQESKLMFDWLITEHNVLHKFGATSMTMKAMIGLDDFDCNGIGNHINHELAATYYIQSSSSAASMGRFASNNNHPADPWRLKVTTPQRQRVIESLSTLLDKLESVLNIRNQADKFRKLQLYELALLSIADKKEDYLDDSSLPNRLAVMLASFHKYIHDTMLLNPTLVEEVQRMILERHEEHQQQLRLQVQLFQQQQHQQQLMLGQLFPNK